MEKNCRHDVMMMAHRIRIATTKNRAICMVQAWQVYKLIERLRDGNVKFAYEKSDGTLRKATGTLCDVSGMLKGTGQRDYNSVCYYDINIRAFRRFRVERLIAVY